MDIETLDLNNFDLNTHEPPNFKSNFANVDDNNDNIDDDYIQSESEYEDSESSEDEYDSKQNENSFNDDIEINLESDYDNEENIDLEECDNIIYSYPFYSNNGIDYEYRVTISDDELLLEQVKCDDNNIDFNNCVEVFSEIYRDTLSIAFDFINKNIDLRDLKTTLKEGIIDYNFDNCSDKEILKSKIENNKISVLYELYKELIDSYVS